MKYTAGNCTVNVMTKQSTAAADVSPLGIEYVPTSLSLRLLSLGASNFLYGLSRLKADFIICVLVTIASRISWRKNMRQNPILSFTISSMFVPKVMKP